MCFVCVEVGIVSEELDTAFATADDSTTDGFAAHAGKVATTRLNKRYDISVRRESGGVSGLTVMDWSAEQLDSHWSGISGRAL